MGKKMSARSEYWRERIAEQERRGMSVQQFCEEQGLTEQSFYVWRKRLQKQQAMRFALVETAPAQRANRKEHGPEQLDVLWQRPRWQHSCRAAEFRGFLPAGQCVDPFTWLKDVLSRIAAHPISRVAELLPHNWAFAQPQPQHR
jgi:hypothetical protein